MAKQLKRMSKQELQAPDKVEQTLWKAFEKVEKYKVPIFAGLGLMGVAAIAIGVFGGMSANTADTKAESLRLALDPFQAPIGEAPETPEAPMAPQQERFEDEAAALTAAETRLGAYISERSGDDSLAAAELALANVHLRRHDHKKAADALSGWLSKYGENPLKPAVLARLAETHASLGDLGKARQSWSALAEASKAGKLKALAHLSLGDLDNPLGNSSGDAAAARKHYEAAKTALGDFEGGGNPLLATLSDVKALTETLDDRIATLP